MRNVTRDVVRDLMPAYLAGEASAGTNVLVEDYLRTDPALAQEALGPENFAFRSPPRRLPRPSGRRSNPPAVC